RSLSTARVPPPRALSTADADHGGRTREVSTDPGVGGRLRRRTGYRTSHRAVCITNTARERRGPRPLDARTEQTAEEPPVGVRLVRGRYRRAGQGAPGPCHRPDE